jgi:hypothetical protein
MAEDAEVAASVAWSLRMFVVVSGVAWAGVAKSQESSSDHTVCTALAMRSLQSLAFDAVKSADSTRTITRCLPSVDLKERKVV